MTLKLSSVLHYITSVLPFQQPFSGSTLFR